MCRIALFRWLCLYLFHIMKAYIKAHWFTILLVVALIICAFILFRSCSKNVSHKGDIKEIKAITKEQNSNAANTTKTVDSIKQVNEDLTMANDILRAQKTRVIEHYTTTIKEVPVLVSDHRKAKEQNDTLKYISNCDSMAAKLVELNSRTDEILSIYEELLDNYKQQLIGKDSIIAMRERQNAELLKALNEITVKTQNIYDDYAKLNKQNKRERTISRILAAATLALGAARLLGK